MGVVDIIKRSSKGENMNMNIEKEERENEYERRLRKVVKDWRKLGFGFYKNGDYRKAK